MSSPSKVLSAAWIPWRQLLPGIAVAALLGAIARVLAAQMATGAVSPVLCAVLLGILWRNTFGVPGWALEGLNWVMRTLLPIGIGLIGLRLTLAGASAVASTALPIAASCIAVAIGSGILISRLLRVPQRLATLLAIGTAVCGCTAVIALAPVIRARNSETAFAIACVVLFGGFAMLCYPWVAGYFFAASPLHAGVFFGTAIHDTSQVIGAGMIYAQQAHAPDALAAASVTKLLRNLAMAVLIPAAAAWMRRQDAIEATDERLPQTQSVPLFVMGFIALILVRTVGDSIFLGASSAALWNAFIEAAHTTSDLALVCVLAAVGLSVSFRQMGCIGWRPLAAGLFIAMAVGACSLSLTLLAQRMLG